MTSFLVYHHLYDLLSVTLRMWHQAQLDLFSYLRL